VEYISPVILVLDTSVLLSDDKILDALSEFDLAIPARVLEELDPFKEGNDYINHAARHFIRTVDRLSNGATLDHWMPLGPEVAGRISVITDEPDTDAKDAFEEGSPDNYMVNSALWLSRREKDRQVILLSNDINLRLKAKALGINASGYNRAEIKNSISQILQSQA
jgi:PhoH-like ATPase